MARRTTSQLDPDKLSGWRLLDDFRQRLVGLILDFPLTGSWVDPRRKLALSEYLCLFLFGLLNPTVRTLRGLSAASRLQRVQEEVCGREVSLASFSELQHLLDPTLLSSLLTELGTEALARNPARRAGGSTNWSGCWQQSWRGCSEPSNGL